MNKPLLLLIFLALIIFAVRFFSGPEDSWVCTNNQWVKHGQPSAPQPQTGCGSIAPTPTVTVSTADAVKNLLAKKYNRSIDTVSLKVKEDLGNFAKGSVSFAGEMGGGLWFAAKTANGWELAFDGNGIVNCDAANKYNFPTSMIPNCLDTAHQNTLVKR